MNKAVGGKKKVTKAITDFVTEKIIDKISISSSASVFTLFEVHHPGPRLMTPATVLSRAAADPICDARWDFSERPYKKAARIVGDVIAVPSPWRCPISTRWYACPRFQDAPAACDMTETTADRRRPPAAMRYTEARLSKYSEYLLRDINKKTVGFVPNFDDEEYEPTVLPAKFPNLLVNGATGISAGYATEIPPHNIDEIIEAVIYKLEHKNASLDKLMEIVKGPDFPTGGIVQGIDGIRRAYKTGRGRIVLKAKTEIVSAKNINQLVITEIPFDVNKAALVKRISEVCGKENIDGVLDIRDETDREGLRIVVDIRQDVNPEDIRNFLFKKTDLQISYNFNMVVIANKRPMLMGLDGLLDAYISHQKDVITNRSNFELNAAKRRLHIVEGLIAMVSILDAVIQTIRSSDNKKDAIANLVSTYDFSWEQAEAIVNLQLYRLTNTDIPATKKQSAYEKKSKLELSSTTLLKVIKNELRAAEGDLSSATVIEHGWESRSSKRAWRRKSISDHYPRRLYQADDANDLQQHRGDETQG